MSDHLIAAYRRQTIATQAARAVARAVGAATDTVVIPAHGRKKAYTQGDTSHARAVPFYPANTGISGVIPGTDPMRDGAGIHDDDCTCHTCRPRARIAS